MSDGGDIFERRGENMKKNLPLFAVFLLGLLLFTVQCTQRRSVNFSELAQNPNAVIIDVRTPEEFAVGHIPQSVNIPLQVLLDSIENLKRFEHIILICRSGNRSGNAKIMLKESGLANSHNGGGWEEFQRRYLR